MCFAELDDSLPNSQQAATGMGCSMFVSMLKTPMIMEWQWDGIGSWTGPIRLPFQPLYGTAMDLM
jgi:hypothetical protein